MRVVLQRVSKASVDIDGESVARISRGLLILLGIEENDSYEDLEWLVRKICGMRIFGDDDGKMNLSVEDIGGELIVVSQFTLHAAVKKGNRPGFGRAAVPDKAIPLYEKFVALCRERLAEKVQTGVFGADMQVSLINDGPVTILIDSKNKE